jgi:hypothetical protein
MFRAVVSAASLVEPGDDQLGDGVAIVLPHKYVPVTFVGRVVEKTDRETSAPKVTSQFAVAASSVLE